MQTRRSNLFGRSQIVIWDTTSHGGVVISASRTNTWHGKGVVRKGDAVYCPKCPPHFFEVSEGLEHCTDTNARLPLANGSNLSSHQTRFRSPTLVRQWSIKNLTHSE
ncbi:MAG TPA: PAAR domain-containing protein [Variovorax sp.]|nr:PAAR domain-containing protein [Variovorax sp.]